MSLKKPKCLTLLEKSLVIQEANNGASVTYLSKKYGVAKSTICKIKSQKQIILTAVSNTYTGPGKRKTLKGSELPKMEIKLYTWFIEQRTKNLIVSGEMLKQKAKALHCEIKERDKEFTASQGWLQRFKSRFGIRFLNISGENLSSNRLDSQIIGDCLRNKLEFPENHEDEDDRPLSVLKRREDKNTGPVSESIDLPNALLPQVKFEDDVLEWNSTDIQCKIEDESETEIEEIQNKISPESAVKAFDVVIEWAEGSEVDYSDVIILKRLREKVVFKSIEKIKTEYT